jgi:hypothetical protein
LEITVLFLGIHKWEPDIYIGFSLALHLQCGVYVHGTFVYVMVKIVKGDGRAPPPTPSRADFSVMMGCTLEIGHCHSVCTQCIYLRLAAQWLLRGLLSLALEGTHRGFPSLRIYAGKNLNIIVSRRRIETTCYLFEIISLNASPQKELLAL